MSVADKVCLRTRSHVGVQTLGLCRGCKEQQQGRRAALPRALDSNRLARARSPAAACTLPVEHRRASTQCTPHTLSHTTPRAHTGDQLAPVLRGRAGPADRVLLLARDAPPGRRRQRRQAPRQRRPKRWPLPPAAPPPPAPRRPAAASPPPAARPPHAAPAPTRSSRDGAAVLRRAAGQADAG
jgi:hypothetical protein